MRRVEDDSKHLRPKWSINEKGVQSSLVRAKLQSYIRFNILSPTHPGIEPRRGKEDYNHRRQPHEGEDENESEKINRKRACSPSARNQPFPEDINSNEDHVSQWDHDKTGHEDDVEENRACS
jgi:hypothetical protein